MSLHLYVQSINNHFYNIDKISLKSNISNIKKCIRHLFKAYNALVKSLKLIYSNQLQTKPIKG